jgi:CheY-like chemotaxis protein
MNDIRPALSILLADDDVDDRFFFRKALASFPILTSLVTVNDGAQLLSYFSGENKIIPDIIFLDLNMPKINGFQCLIELQGNTVLKQIPVIIYSTSADEKDADLLFKNGAHYYVRKKGVAELKNVFHYIFPLLAAHTLTRPLRDNFVLDI